MKTFKKAIYLTVFIFSAVTLSAGNVPARDKTEELAASIDQIISNVNCSVSLQIVSADKYDLLYEYNPELKMIPASITKLITAAVAFEELGVSYDFKTVLYTDDSDIKDGVIDGNLYLKGYGDPDLGSSDISELAKQLSEKSIREITGNIIYDESFLDDDHYGLANSFRNDTKQNYWPYVSAINFNKNGGGYDPASTAATYLLDELTALNVKVNGIVIAGNTPEKAKEVGDVFHTFYEVIAHMNKESDNHSAITVFKVVGAKRYSPPGTIEKGEDAVVNFLTSAPPAPTSAFSPSA